jgi:hypothetical protein
MSLTFLGPKGAVERRWVVYALLRDNVQHHLEGGEPGKEFLALHELGEALVRGEVTVPAAKLHQELVRAREALLSRPIGELAASVRTRAVMTLSFPLPDARGTALVSESGWTPPVLVQGAETLADVFGSLLLELIAATEGAADGEVVRVIDG